MIKTYLNYFCDLSAVTSILLCIDTAIVLCNSWDNNLMLRIHVKHLLSSETVCWHKKVR